MCSINTLASGHLATFTFHFLVIFVVVVARRETFQWSYTNLTHSYTSTSFPKHTNPNTGTMINSLRFLGNFYNWPVWEYPAGVQCAAGLSPDMTDSPTDPPGGARGRSALLYFLSSQPQRGCCPWAPSQRHPAVPHILPRLHCLGDAHWSGGNCWRRRAWAWRVSDRVKNESKETKEDSGLSDWRSLLCALGVFQRCHERSPINQGCFWRHPHRNG